MAEAIIIVNNSQPTAVVDVERNEADANETSQFERYKDDDAPSHEEGHEVEADLAVEKNGDGDAQEKENSGPDDAAPDVSARTHKKSLRSPKTMMLSKLKPFSPRSRTTSITSPNGKSKHFFHEPSPKSKPSSKVTGTSVLSPRAARMSPKKTPVEPSPKVQGDKLLSPRVAVSPAKSSVAAEKTAEEKVSLAVAPGRLGLSLKIDKQRGGAKIVSIDPRCAFHGKVDIGDHIVGIDDRKVRELNDFKVDSDKKRNFIIRRNKKAPGQELTEDVTTMSDGPKTTRAKTPKASGDLSQQFSLVEMNSSLMPSLLGPSQSYEQDNLEFEANTGRCPTFNCNPNRYNCASTVTSDSTSSIKTFFKPVTSLMECGQSHAGDHSIYAGDIRTEPPEEMNRKAPSIAQISQLQISDHAFIKRSNGEWTYSTVLDKERGSITFAVDSFGNGKTITKHRWKSSIRLVASAEHSFESSVDDYEPPEDDYEPSEDDYESSIAEEYSASLSSSGSEDYSELDSPLSSPMATPSAAQRKAKLKAMVDKKKMDLKAKKQEQKKRAKAAAAEAKRKERELKDAQELEIKLRLMHLEEEKLKEAEEEEKRRQRMNEEKMAKKIADRKDKKRRKLAKVEAEREEMRRRKLAEEEEKKRIALSMEEDKKRIALLAKSKSEKEAKVDMKKLQKAKKQAAALEAQRQAELMFKDLEASVASPVAGREAANVSDVAGEVNDFVNEFFLCEM
ncbi:hypothetical protein ACHAWT_009721 [Skeletonema menzelii]